MREFFSQFGKVIDSTVMLDRETGRSKGFGFVSFEDTNVQPFLGYGNLEIDGKLVRFVLSFITGYSRRNSFFPPYRLTSNSPNPVTSVTISAKNVKVPNSELKAVSVGSKPLSVPAPEVQVQEAQAEARRSIRKRSQRSTPGCSR
jgi:RNA recognition motif-containing protein